MEYKTTGIILAREIVNDYDVLATIYTLENGLVRAVYPRAKKRPAVMAALELFNEDTLVISSRKIWDLIYSIDAKTTFNNLRTNYEAYAVACYFANIVSSVSLPGQPGGAIYRLLFSSLAMLDNGQKIDNVREYFHVCMLKTEGLLSAEQEFVTEEQFNTILMEYINRKGGGKFGTGTNKVS